MDSGGGGDFNQSSPGPDETAAATRTQVQPDPEVSWWFRVGVRIIGAVAGVLCMIFGLWRCITFTPICLVAGILMMVLGFIVVVLEAPVCCQWLDLVDRVTKWVDLRPYWHKAAAYFVLAIVPVAICPSLASFLGCGAVFVTGVLYGLMAVGKKGDAVRIANVQKRQDQFAMESKMLMDGSGQPAEGPGSAIRDARRQQQHLQFSDDPEEQTEYTRIGNSATNGPKDDL